MNPITIDKTYKYRNGEPARILCTDAPGREPVVSLMPDGTVVQHTAEGRYYYEDGEHDFDLIEVHEPRRIWRNYYRDGGVASFSSEEEAKASAGCITSESYREVAVEFVEVLK